ncbi:MAG: glycosyltransferase [Patescibacteria group bacterium]
MRGLVSVVIPVYNASHFLEDAFDSVINQTYRNIEIIAVDDCSYDGSESILKEYVKKGKIKLIVNKSNLGDAASRNRGLLEITGEYYAPMDADDICLPGRILKEVEFLQNHKECVLVGGQAVYIDEHSKYLGTSNYPTKISNIATHVWRRNPVAHSSVLTRSDLVKRVGTYSGELRTCSDYDLWLRLIKYGYLANLGEVVIKYRLHPNQMSQYDYSHLLRTTTLLQNKYKHLYNHKANLVDKIYSTIYWILLKIPSKTSNRIVNYFRSLSRFIGGLGKGTHD